MTRKAFPICLIAVVILAGYAAGQQKPQVDLAWKLKEGDKLHVELVDSEKTALAALGQDLKTETTMKATLTVEKITKGGPIVLAQRIDSLKTQGGGLAATFIDNIFREIEGSTIKVHLDENYQFQKLEGAEEIVKRAADKAQVPPQAAGLVDSLISATLLKPCERLFGVKLPGKPVAKGDKWSQKLAAPLGLLGKISIVHNYTYQGTSDGLHRIEVTPAITFSNEENKGGGLGGLTVKKADLKAETAKGNIYFDTDKGRMTGSDMTMRIKGTLTLSAMNQDFPLEVDIEMQNKMTLTPAKEK
ncbi:MAG: DUF6263 family protein [Gemmatales bacterium]|nr:DUF6263 family protein [Gemmatales bacterium]MDW8385738.1 DUF6263 family protein [Gemmatales bacterium]